MTEIELVLHFSSTVSIHLSNSVCFVILFFAGLYINNMKKLTKNAYVPPFLSGKVSGLAHSDA